MEPSRPEAHPVLARIDAIDVLRGLALFGVLVINLVYEFRVSIFEQFLPATEPVGGIDRAANAVLAALFEFKAFVLFSFLVGVGLAIQHDRLARRDDRLVLLVRRLTALLAFGLLHLVFIWNGDILTEYAVAGLVVLPLLRAPRWAVAIAACAALLLYLMLPWLSLPIDLPGPAWLQAHVAAAHATYGHGSWPAIQAFRMAEIPALAALHLQVFARTVALILIGVLVWRSGALERPAAYTRLFASTAAAALAVAMALSIASGSLSTRSGLALPAHYRIIAGTLAPIALAAAYAALVFMIVPGRRAASLVGWAAPVGRMAFSNYIAQSLLLGLVFYGYGLGLMGRIGVAAGVAIAVAIFVAQAFTSRWWLRNHPFGPLEWLWRTLMYGARQPWRRRRSTGTSG